MAEKKFYILVDVAFCARMHVAIAAGLECAPTSVSTAPGTKNPKYVSDLTAKYHRPVNERQQGKEKGHPNWVAKVGGRTASSAMEARLKIPTTPTSGLMRSERKAKGL